MVTLTDLIIDKVIKKLKGKKNFPMSLIYQTINEVLEGNKELTVNNETKHLLYPNVCQALMNRKDLNV